MTKYGKSDDYRKVLKTIDTKNQSEVSDNIYGYT